MSNNKGKPVGFRRIRGRVIPIYQRESHAAASIGRASIVTGAGAAVLGATSAGLGAIWGAGRLERHSQAIAAKGGTALKVSLFNRGAKMAKFLGKYGSALAVGHQIARIDRATTADEKAKYANLGAGSNISAPRIIMMAAGAYGFGRVAKRFEKFGLRGGAFPWKLKDI